MGGWGVGMGDRMWGWGVGGMGSGRGTMGVGVGFLLSLLPTPSHPLWTPSGPCPSPSVALLRWRPHLPCPAEVNAYTLVWLWDPLGSCIKPTRVLRPFTKRETCSSQATS